MGYRLSRPTLANWFAKPIPVSATASKVPWNGVTRAMELPLVVTGPRSDLPRASRRSWRAVGETALALLAANILTTVPHLWPAQLTNLAILLALPGFLVLRATGMSLSRMARPPGLLPVVSLVVLSLTGLTADLLGPAFGVSQPLRAVPLLVVLDVTCLALAALPGRATPLDGVRILADGIELRSAALLGLPLLALLGTFRLNATGGSSLALVAATAAVLLLALAVWFARTWTTQRLYWALYASTTALLLGFAMRSSYVFGWDISAEYGLVRQTLVQGIWETSHPADAYGAMLSLTVLPALLHAISGISGVLLLKLVYPALFGLFPVIAFALLRRVLSTRTALLAALLLLTQASFLREMPALARQELGLLAYICLLAVMLDRHMRRVPQISLLVLLSFGVTVFHYSTNYTLISLLLLAVIVEFVVSFWHGTPRFDPRKVGVLLLTLGLGFFWYVGLTHSTLNATRTASGLLQSGIQILPNAPAGSNPIEAYLKGTLAQPLTVGEYQKEIAQFYQAKRPWVVKAPDAADPRWQLTSAKPPTEKPRSALLASLVNLLVLVVSQLINMLAVVGALLLLLRRRVPTGLLDFAILALPAILLLGLVRLSGTLAGYYGQDRLLIQLLPIVSVPVFWLLSSSQRSMRRALDKVGAWPERFFIRIATPAVVGVLAGALIFQIAAASGLVAAALGQPTSSNLYNAGENFERFYVTAPEVSAAEWLASAQPRGTLTYTDLYGQLRLYAYGDVKGTLLTDITPETTDVNAWVYATRANVVGGRARARLDSGSLVYAFPRTFLENQLGIVYSNGTSEVYHR